LSTTFTPDCPDRPAATAKKKKKRKEKKEKKKDDRPAEACCGFKSTRRSQYQDKEENTEKHTGKPRA